MVSSNPAGPGMTTTCPDCDGTGKTPVVRYVPVLPSPPFDVGDDISCEIHDGTISPPYAVGEEVRAECATCGGDGCADADPDADCPDCDGAGEFACLSVARVEPVQKRLPLTDTAKMEGGEAPSSEWRWRVEFRRAGA